MECINVMKMAESSRLSGKSIYSKAQPQEFYSSYIFRFLFILVQKFCFTCINLIIDVIASNVRLCILVAFAALKILPCPLYFLKEKNKIIVCNLSDL